MTPQRVADISEPIEQIYEDITDELLLNIAKHLSSSTTTLTALHEIETLGTMGQLTEENIRIINKYVQKIPQAVKDAMNDSRLEALSEIEDKLALAASNGYLEKPATDGTLQVAQDFATQAASQLNLVNQTMLNSSLEAYRQGIANVQAGYSSIADEDELSEAQNIIDLAAGQVALGTETRTGALKKALQTLNSNGITGFYDKTGRAWSAEAYVNMDIRTTVHNTYIQSIKTRQEDYGSDVFQVSAHAGARPLCYPYQGKMYSWGDSGGKITLGDGKTYRFESIKTTSYGKPAGLFGINCGHVPYPMIPAVSEPVDEDIPPKAENDKEYQESQRQRALERNIRYQKRQLAMLGDLATDADKQRLRDYQAQMRAFIKETGRTRRYDREQIVTEASGDYFHRARTKKDALTAMKKYASNVNLRDLSLKELNDINEELYNLAKKYSFKPYREIRQDNRISGNAQSNYSEMDINSKKLRNAGRRSKENWNYNRELSQQVVDFVNRNYGGVPPASIAKEWPTYLDVLKYTRGNVANAYGTKGIIAHEFGHTLSDQYFGMINGNRANPNADSQENLAKVQKVKDVYNIAMNNGDIFQLSKYASRDADEFLAEAFAAKEMGELLPDYISDMLDEVLKP